MSAEVSFGASAALGAAGLWTLRQTLEPGERAIASLPLLFAVQQFCEGVVWVGLTHGRADLVSVGSYLYALFAFLLWPALVPLAVLWIEPRPARRRTLTVLFVVGVCTAAFLAITLVRHGLTTQVAEGHIGYWIELSSFHPSFVFYLLAVSSPCVSSHRYLQGFGGLLVIALAGTFVHQSLAFVSLWCLFAALLSGTIAAHLVAERVSPATPAST